MIFKAVSYLDSMRFDSFKSDQTIFINGSWQHSISLIVNVLANNIDSTWSSRNEIWFGSIFLLKTKQNRLVSDTDWTGVVFLNIFWQDCLDHVKICSIIVICELIIIISLMKRKYQTGSNHLIRKSIINGEHQIDMDIPDGDVQLGRQLYKQYCLACHNITQVHSTGPTLHNIYGKRACSQPKYGFYSRDLRACRFGWSKHKLFQLLTDPEQFLGIESPMQFNKVQDRYDRACIIEYLHYLRIHTAKTVKPEWINQPYE